MIAWILIVLGLIGLPFYLDFLVFVCSETYFESKLDYQRRFFTEFEPTYDEQESE